MKLPFFQFYPADYKRDTCALSLAAKGGWIDILCMLHGAKERGTLTLPILGWARVMGSEIEQAEAVIAELRDLQIADVQRDGNGNVTLSSRRMLREHITREQTRLRVVNHRRNAAEKRNCNADVTHNKSEDRSQKTEYKTLGSAVGTAPASDSEWLAGLKSNPAFEGIDVDREFAKMLAWCQANRKKGSRRRFVNWLNRVDRPISAGPIAKPRRIIPEPPGWKAHLNHEFPENRFAANQPEEAHQWADLDEFTQTFLSNHMRKAGMAG